MKKEKPQLKSNSKQLNMRIVVQLTICLYMLLPSFKLQAQGITISLNATQFGDYHVSCTETRDGALTATVTGGTAPYTYLWSNGETTATINGLGAGYYTVTVTDAQANAKEDGMNLLAPEPIDIKVLVQEYPNKHNISCYNCFNGSINTIPSGGVAPYTYQWEDGPTTQNRTSLGIGNYFLTITDANGCHQHTEPLKLSQPERSDWTMGGNSGTNPSSIENQQCRKATPKRQWINTNARRTSVRKWIEARQCHAH
jgi:hypothetical protein